MASYTIKEAADALGVSKQAVRYHLKKIGGQFRKDERGIAVIPAEVFEEIRARIGGKEVVNGDSFTGKQVVNEQPFTGKKPVKSENFTGKEVVNEEPFTGKQEGSAEAVALAVLREQIAVKDAQIASLTAQLEGVTEALRAAQRSLEGAQALHAGTIQAQLQEAATDEPEPVDEAPGEPERKRGLFGWLKRGK